MGVSRHRHLGPGVVAATLSALAIVTACTVEERAVDDLAPRPGQDLREGFPPLPGRRQPGTPDTTAVTQVPTSGTPTPATTTATPAATAGSTRPDPPARSSATEPTTAAPATVPSTTTDPAAPASTGTHVHAHVQVAVDELNRWRAIARQPPVVADPWLSFGAQAHAQYLQLNGLSVQSAHRQQAGRPGYTPEGALAATRSVVTGWPYGTRSTEAIRGLMTAPLHAVEMLHPNLTAVGWGESHGSTGSQFVLDVRSGVRSETPTRIVMFPGHQQTSTLRTLSTAEWPNPIAPCRGFTHPVGMAVIAIFPSDAAVTAATLTRNGQPVDVCWYDRYRFDTTDPHSSQVGTRVLSMHNAVVVIPKHPLQPGNYQATIRRLSGTLRWDFTIG